MRKPFLIFIVVLCVVAAFIGGAVLVEMLNNREETAPITTVDEGRKALETAPVVEDAVAPDDAFGINQAVVRPDGTAVIAGTAAPGAEIKLYRNGRLIGTATADGNGDWVIIPDEALPPGEHLLHLEIITADGTSPGSRALVVEIPQARDQTPLVLLVPYDDADIPPIVLQAPDENIAAAPEDGMPFVRIRTVATRDDNRLHVSGRASGGETVVISAGDATARARVNAGQYETSGGLAFDKAATRIVIIAQLQGCGEAACTARVRLDANAISKALRGDSLVVIEKGDALWRIAYRSYGAGIRYVDIYRNNAEQIGDPDLIYPDQIFAIPDAK